MSSNPKDASTPQTTPVLGNPYLAAELASEKYSSHLATQVDIDALKARVGVRDPNKDYNVIVNGFGTGAAPPTEEEWNSLVGNLVIVNSVSDPPTALSVDISQSPYFPVVGNQGYQGSCSAWSVAYYSNSYMQAKDNGWTDASTGNPDHLMSPAWAYNKANGGTDDGSLPHTIMKLIQTVGNANLSSMPYDDMDFISWGTEAAWRSAPEFRTRSIEVTYPWNTNILKSWLDEDSLLTITLDANQYDNGLGFGDDTMTSSEYISGNPNHANTIVGYDDTKAQGGEVGSFKIVNSWGAGWGSDWGGNGFYWMTYEAVSELISPVWRFHDRPDYDPTFLATWELNPQGSRDALVVLGIGPYSQPDDTRIPIWDGGGHDFPSFMALDVTEFEEEWDAGVPDFFLRIGSGATSSTITSFKIERYDNGYLPYYPSMISDESLDTPEVTPGYVTVFFRTLLGIDNPLEGAFVRGTTNVSGWATDSWNSMLYHEGFEYTFPGSWTVGDSNSTHGEDYWGASPHRFYGGTKSAWAAQIGDKWVNETVLEEDFEDFEPMDWMFGDSDSDHGDDYWGTTDHRSYDGNTSAWSAQVGDDTRVLYSQDFDNGGSMPTGWSTQSDGPDVHPWEMKLDSGSDYRAECNSEEAGAGTDITEWLYMTTSFNATNYTALTIEFYLDYAYNDGSEYASVLYSTSVDFPTYTELERWTSTTIGTQSLDLSVANGDPEVYVAFIYHGTYDLYMRVDDLLIKGTISNNVSHQYDDNMSGYMFTSVNLTTYDYGNLSYNLWLDAEDTHDYFYAIYYEVDTWYFEGDTTGNSGGWQIDNVTVPSAASEVGFFFYTDDAGHDNEGAYVDNVTLIGTGIKPNNESHTYDDNMSAYMYIDVDLSGASNPILSYRYWLDAEDTLDYLYAMYYDAGSWNYVNPCTGNSGGWRLFNFSLPVTTTYIGFFFQSDADEHDFEGAYVDDVFVINKDLLSSVSVKIDDGAWDLASGGAEWWYDWDTTAYPDGPHTVHVNASFGSRYYNQSVSVIVDNTPPDNPSSSSSSHTPSVWSTDNTIWMSWSGADDATSGVCGYSINWTNSSTSLPDTIMDTSASDIISQPLDDGNNWYFHVRTVDNAGNWALGAYHVGAFLIDTTPPSNPDSYLSSHSVLVWSNNNIVSINWSGATDATSGIMGYSFDWNQSPSLVPDMTVNTTMTNTTSPPLVGSDSWYFHVRSVDNASNWAVGAFHVGPFRVDIEPPSSTHILTGLEGFDNWYMSNVTVQIDAADDWSGVNQTKYRLVPGGWNNYTIDFQLSTDGVHPVEYYSVDNVSNIESIKSVDVKIDKVAPTNPDDYNSDHTVGVWSNESDVFVEWLGAFDGTSGVYGYSIVWDRLPLTIPDDNVNTTTTNTTALGLADGNDWYLHIRTRDVAGNWAADAYHIGPFWIDSSAPLPGSFVHANIKMNWIDVNISWDLSPDDPIDVVRYDILYSTQYNAFGAGYVLLASVPSGTDYYVHENAGWGDPNNYFYIVEAVDVAEKATAYPDQVGKFVRSLNTGWHLVSTPLVQENTSLWPVLKTVDFDCVRYYDPFDTSDPWKAYFTFKGYKDLHQMNHSMGVWVNVRTDSDFVVAGVVPQFTEIQLKKGWNLVSFPSFADDYTVADLKAETNVTSMEGLDPLNGPYFLRSMQDSEYLEAGYAYWVLVSEDCTWAVSN